MKKILIKRFGKTLKFCNNDINKFIFLLRKVIYPYEYMDNCKRFDETSLPEKEDFYSNLNIGVDINMDLNMITDVDCNHAKKVWKKIRIKNLGEYHNLYVQSNTLLLANIFEIHELDLAHFLSAPRLPWGTCLKQTEI